VAGIAKEDIMRCWPVLFLGLLLAIDPARAQIGEITKTLGLGKSSKLGDDKIVAGGESFPACSNPYQYRRTVL
jgi:hypothetical protein